MKPSAPTRIALAGALLSAVTAVPLVAAPPAQAQDMAQAGGGIAGQAIAVSRGGQRWGVGHAVGTERWNTLLRAAQQAMLQCGHYDCRVQFQSINPSDRCMILARGTRSYGIGVGPTPDHARRQAIESCSAATTNCRVVDTRCPQ